MWDDLWQTKSQMSLMIKNSLCSEWLLSEYCLVSKASQLLRQGFEVNSRKHLSWNNTPMLSVQNSNFIFLTSDVKMFTASQLQSICLSPSRLNPSELTLLKLKVKYPESHCFVLFCAMLGKKYSGLRLFFPTFFTFRCVKYCICGIPERFSYSLYIFRGCTVFKSCSYKRPFKQTFCILCLFPHFADFHASYWSVSSRAIRLISAHVDGEHFRWVCTVYLRL